MQTGSGFDPDQRLLGFLKTPRRQNQRDHSRDHDACGQRYRDYSQWNFRKLAAQNQRGYGTERGNDQQWCGKCLHEPTEIDSAGKRGTLILPVFAVCAIT